MDYALIAGTTKINFFRCEGTATPSNAITAKKVALIACCGLMKKRNYNTGSKK